MVVEGKAVRDVPYGHADLLACYKLRHAYFVRKRAWVPEDESQPGMECDRYDAQAIHLACFDAHGVAAYLRALPYDPGLGFMFDHEFAGLLCEEERALLTREKALELSRLVVRPGLPLRIGRDAPHPLEEVLRLLYSLSSQQGYDRYYIVVEPDWLLPFERRFGLPFRTLGQPKLFPDGTSTVLAVAMLEELESRMRHWDPQRYRWYQSEEFESVSSIL